MVTWREPYIEADGLFTAELAMPLPLISGQRLSEAPSRFLSHSYWRDSYVGLGPFRLQGWVRQPPGADRERRLLAGRPKIDEIEVRFITEINAMLANLLSGAVTYPIESGHLGIEQALQIREMTDQVRVDSATAWVDRR